jgi:hypothetical protein
MLSRSEEFQAHGMMRRYWWSTRVLKQIYRLNVPLDNDGYRIPLFANKHLMTFRNHFRFTLRVELNAQNTVAVAVFRYYAL